MQETPHEPSLPGERLGRTQLEGAAKDPPAGVGQPCVRGELEGNGWLWAEERAVVTARIHDAAFVGVVGLVQGHQIAVGYERAIVRRPDADARFRERDGEVTRRSLRPEQATAGVGAEYAQVDHRRVKYALLPQALARGRGQCLHRTMVA